MARKIFCTYLQRETEGMESQVYPGKIGRIIYNDISKEAWKEWIIKQTKIINEKKLNLINPEDRFFLENEMINFLSIKNKCL
ncbi:oxidative damage protection protein [Candidatus Ishikawella capsulata]|uniref:Fe(2+)-trafficking protein n=1 Tax=Candidatus Ishikawaella capsulata Mpkobe TaxID=476281 RepID=C5WDK1_9ENTR|nr:oxidative damage protection protein [Candidatus Ishikawaella capsulata]BAH83407.1 hypothetical protein ICMP_566 [Candidatus Ishikawaella capsulata Mpkobe]